MTQALLQANKKIFGSSTEATNYVEGQLSLFKTNEELAKVLIEEQKKITVPSHKRVPRKPGVRAEMLDGLPKEIIEEFDETELKVCVDCLKQNYDNAFSVTDIVKETISCG